MADPSTIATLSAWWRADTTGLADNAAVASWSDSGSGGNTATQATSTAQPTFKTGIVNALPVVRFDGTSDYLTSAASSSHTSTTLFAVLKPINTTGTFTIRGAISGTTPSGGLQWRINAGKQELLKQGIVQVGITGSTTTVPTASFSILCVSYVNSSNYAFYFNGTPDGGGSHTETLVTGQTTNIGYNYDQLGEFFSGDLAELIVYSSLLSNADRATVDSYLSDKYAITITDYVSSDILRVPIQTRRPT